NDIDVEYENTLIKEEQSSNSDEKVEKITSKMATFGANFTIPVFVPGESKWERWLQRFKGALAIMKVTDDKLKATYLLYYVGDKAYDVLCDTFGDVMVSTKKYEKLSDKLKEMYASVTLEIAENFKFNCRKQQLGESVQDFAMALKKLGASCGFGDFLQKALRNQFVYGLSNQRIQNRLLETKDLTFEKVLQIANATELCEKETTQLRGENGRRKLMCTLKCEVRKQNQKGHLEKICMQKGNTPRQIPQTEEDSHFEVVDILNVFSVEDFQNREKFVRELNVSNTEVNFEVDMGAAVSIMFYETAKQLFPGERVYKSSLQLVTYYFSPILGLGAVTLTMKPDAKPVFVKSRSVPFRLIPLVDAALESLEKGRVLELVSSSPYATPIVPILKSNGTVRICGDYSVTVNSQLMVNEYPLPATYELLVDLAGWYSE
ncbi:uncharacterized protein LOC106644646, partial [Copidosoma floridanum]|uniref:uncharacterized protein LOC106644646 n=1 Tax=Copidosoma floridanum TaxID=29053 RepID=UPI0006C98631